MKIFEAASAKRQPCCENTYSEFLEEVDLENLLFKKQFNPFFDQCSTHGQTRLSVFTRVTFSVKMHVIDLHLCLKCHSSTGVFQTFW